MSPLKKEGWCKYSHWCVIIKMKGGNKMEAHQYDTDGQAGGEVRTLKAKRPQPCLCGCGQVVMSGRNFLPGHDAKLKSVLLKVEKGELDESAIPEQAKATLVPCKCCGNMMLPHLSGMGPICRSGKCKCHKGKEGGVGDAGGN
jgi:hypothetical protein